MKKVLAFKKHLSNVKAHLSRYNQLRDDKGLKVLLLDLDDTLVYCDFSKGKSEFYPRPGLREFFKFLADKNIPVLFFSRNSCTLQIVNAFRADYEEFPAVIGSYFSLGPKRMEDVSFFLKHLPPKYQEVKPYMIDDAPLGDPSKGFSAINHLNEDVRVGDLKYIQILPWVEEEDTVLFDVVDYLKEIPANSVAFQPGTHITEAQLRHHEQAVDCAVQRTRRLFHGCLKDNPQFDKRIKKECSFKGELKDHFSLDCEKLVGNKDFSRKINFLFSVALTYFQLLQAVRMIYQELFLGLTDPLDVHNRNAMPCCLVTPKGV